VDNMQKTPDLELRNKIKKGIFGIFAVIGGLMLIGNLANALSIGAPSATTNNAAGVGGSGGGGGATSPGGADTDVQYNKSGAFFGDGNFSYNYSNASPYITINSANFYNDNTNANLFIGKNSGVIGTTNPFNVAIGTNALGNLTAGGQINVAIGVDAGQNCTSGIGNVFIGVLAAQGITTGGSNVAIGQRALQSDTTDSNNVAIGGTALNALTSGSGNMAIGTATMSALTSGQSNVGIGNDVFPNMVTGNNNVAIGAAAMQNNNGGSQNTGLGIFAGYGNVTGTYNSYVGYLSGYNSSVTLSTLTYCTMLGAYANSSTNGLTNSTAVGNAAQITASNQVVLGNTSVTQLVVGSGASISTTIALAKLTTLGSNGSVTIVNGIVTAYVAPT
jgi:trimeric autotransporter adhesin